MKIAFIGNCQLLTLCYYTQLLTQGSIDARWCCYGDEFLPHLDGWSDKCANKIIDYDTGQRFVSEADVVICNSICAEKSPLFNISSLKKIVKPGCRIIAIPPMYFIVDKPDESIKELVRREELLPCEYISISDIYMKEHDKHLALTCCHPTTFFFMKVMEKLCNELNIPFFSLEDYSRMIQNPNIMGLP